MGGKLKNHKLLRNLKAAKCTGKKALMAAKICIDRFKKKCTSSVSKMLSSDDNILETDEVLLRKC
jgi:hypothetical protein